jgi:hypothetical protein
LASAGTRGWGVERVEEVEGDDLVEAVARLIAMPLRCKRLVSESWEITWNRPQKGEGEGLMGNSQGRDNVKKRAARRKKTERLALAKTKTTKKAKK